VNRKPTSSQRPIQRERETTRRRPRTEQSGAGTAVQRKSHALTQPRERTGTEQSNLAG
jgi:hypothetical protein